MSVSLRRGQRRISLTVVVEEVVLDGVVVVLEDVVDEVVVVVDVVVDVVMGVVVLVVSVHEANRVDTGVEDTTVLVTTPVKGISVSLQESSCAVSPQRVLRPTLPKEWLAEKQAGACTHVAVPRTVLI